MRGIAFYLEFPNAGVKKRSGKAHKGHSGNVFAAFMANGWHEGTHGKPLIEGLGALYGHPDSPVAGTSASREFLDSCKRVSECEARRMHPELFRRLDQD